MDSSVWFEQISMLIKRGSASPALTAGGGLVDAKACYSMSESTQVKGPSTVPPVTRAFARDRLWLCILKHTLESGLSCASCAIRAFIPLETWRNIWKSTQEWGHTTALYASRGLGVPVSSALTCAVMNVSLNGSPEKLTIQTFLMINTLWFPEASTKKPSVMEKLTGAPKVEVQEKLFECTHCGKRFSQHCLLQIHQRIHTGERPYKCSQCGLSFRWRRNLIAHQSSHPGENPLQCSMCDEAFVSEASLKHHQDAFHSGQTLGDHAMHMKHALK